MRCLVTAVALTTALSASAVAQVRTAPAAPQLKEHNEAWMVGTRPRDPFADQKGRVWFVGQEGNYVGRLNTDGSIQRFEVDPARTRTTSSSTRRARCGLPAIATTAS